MKLELLNEIVGGIAGAKKEGASVLIPDNIDFALYVGLAAEVITIARLSRVTIAPELMALETHKGERYYFSPLDVVGARTLPGKDTPAGRASAGFR